MSFDRLTHKDILDYARSIKAPLCKVKKDKAILKELIENKLKNGKKMLNTSTIGNEIEKRKFFETGKIVKRRFNPSNKIIKQDEVVERKDFRYKLDKVILSDTQRPKDSETS